MFICVFLTFSDRTCVIKLGPDFQQGFLDAFLGNLEIQETFGRLDFLVLM